MLERGPYVTAADVGTWWERDDGSLWMLESYCAEPTVSFRRVYPVGPTNHDRRGGAVGSPITAGFNRMVREDGQELALEGEA